MWVSQIMRVFVDINILRIIALIWLSLSNYKLYDAFILLVTDLSQVVQQVSRLARSFDGPATVQERGGNIRVARQLGGAPLGPPGPYRSVI